MNIKRVKCALTGGCKCNQLPCKLESGQLTITQTCKNCGTTFKFLTPATKLQQIADHIN